MRKIEEQLVNAVLAEAEWTNSNTSTVVTELGYIYSVVLFGNVIMYKKQGHWYLKTDILQAYDSLTTRSRVNAMATIFNDSFEGIRRSKGVTYILYDGKEIPLTTIVGDFFIGK